MTRRHLYLLTVLGMLTALAPVINNMFSPAMPGLAAAFGIDIGTAGLGLTASMLGLALGQIIIGPMTDRWGRQQPLLWSMVALVVASVTCVFSPTATTLLILRVIQGLAAGGGIVIARSMAADVSRGAELLKTMAVINVFNGLAPIVTPMLGSALAAGMGWTGPMVGMAAVAAVLLAACTGMPESLPEQNRVHTNFSNTLTLFARVTRNRPCIFTILHQGAALAVLFGNIAFTPSLVMHCGLAPASIGLALGVNGIFTALGAGAAAGMGSGERGMRVTATGLVVSCVAMAVVLLGDLGFWPYEVVISVMLFFVGVTLTASSGHAMDCARHEAGTASALLGAVGFVVGGVVAPLMSLGNLFVGATVVYVLAALMSLVFARQALAPTSGHQS